jgi:hypothetical protein
MVLDMIRMKNASLRDVPQRDYSESEVSRIKRMEHFPKSQLLTLSGGLVKIGN